MKARTLFFRGFITKKRSQIKGRYLVFRNLYLIDLEENAPREEICSHGEGGQCCRLGGGTRDPGNRLRGLTRSWVHTEKA